MKNQDPDKFQHTLVTLTHKALSSDDITVIGMPIAVALDADAQVGAGARSVMARGTFLQTPNKEDISN